MAVVVVESYSLGCPFDQGLANLANAWDLLSKGPTLGLTVRVDVCAWRRLALPVNQTQPIIEFFYPAQRTSHCPLGGMLWRGEVVVDKPGGTTLA